MSLLSTELTQRSDSHCELCTAGGELFPFIVAPKTGNHVDEQVAVCSVCLDQIEHPENIDPEHWRILNDTIWSPIPAIQVVSYRMLHLLSDQNWAQDLLGMMYMDESTTEWAESGSSDTLIHKDCNGQILQAGDTVTLIKDLEVRGANFTAKRGTAVRRISLVQDNPGQIEGRVNDQQIVILTEFVKKS